MSDHENNGGRDSTDGGFDRPNDDGDAVGSVEAYESDGKTVLYDADNPLAWVETTRALSLRECA